MRRATPSYAARAGKGSPDRRISLRPRSFQRQVASDDADSMTQSQRESWGDRGPLGPTWQMSTFSFAATRSKHRPPLRYQAGGRTIAWLGA